MTVVGDLLSHPLVLRGAWMRIEEWYRSGNMAPQPEFAQWQFHPEAELRELAKELREGTWSPSPWLQVPYPKKGAQLRHYVMPTVRDQVAFMALLVLLGPLIDARIANFAFGNRWYRPIWWDRRRKPHPGWRWLPYPLLSRRSYQPYARSYGLYRRVAHWTAARMVGQEVRADDYGGKVPVPDDYEKEALPEWSRADWWKGAETEGRRVAWAALDIQLAYPSVRLDRLREAFTEMLALGSGEQGGEKLELEDLTFEAGEDPLEGFPPSIRVSLQNVEVVRGLVDSLVTSLEGCRTRNRIPERTWKPPHARARTHEGAGAGLPTGLAVSGLLLNVALWRTDSSIEKYLKGVARGRGAFLRFADDMIVMSTSIEGMLELVEKVWRAVEHDEGGERTNLYLNIGKIGPEAVQRLVRTFLTKNGWQECKETCCGALLPPDKNWRPSGLKDWWWEWEKRSEAAGREGQDETLGDCRAALVEGLQRAMVGKDDLGPFVTSLVERLSEIGRDNLGDRFGPGARARLQALHELARFDIADDHVKADTRRLFAANRLAMAWLPQGKDEERRALAEIRDSVAHVLRKTPWKFALWRSIVRVAARRPMSAEAGSDREDSEAEAWLQRQLRQIAWWDRKEDIDSVSWAAAWPEEGGENLAHGRGETWKKLYLSYHRTVFWHVLADTLRDLWRHHELASRRDAWDAGPSPRWWTRRGIPAGQHEKVARWLGQIDRWVEVLYARAEGVHEALTEWEWELDALVEAVLATVRQGALAEGFRRSYAPRSVEHGEVRAAEPRGRRAAEQLCVPEMLEHLKEMPKTRKLLEDCGRILRTRGKPRKLRVVDLAHVRLAGRDRALKEVLVSSRTGGLRVELTGKRQGRLAVILGILEECPGKKKGKTTLVDRSLGDLVQRLQEDPLLLWDYERERRVLLGCGSTWSGKGHR